MRREKIDLWLVICREYNEDPVFLTCTVPLVSARRTTMLVFFDRGEKGVERLSVQPTVTGAYIPRPDPKQTDPWQCLVDLIAQRNPKKSH